MTLISETHDYYKRLINCIYLEQDLKYRFYKYKSLGKLLLDKYVKTNNKTKNKLEKIYDNKKD